VTHPPVALTIAGSDPSGGAGIQADLKTFSALGAYGTTVMTALTAQSTQGVTGVHPVPLDFVRQQWQTLVDDVHVDTIKVGMLGSAAHVDLVGTLLDDSGSAYVVLDPVMVATSGDRLLDVDAVEAIRGLAPHADLVTPNVAEAAILLGTEPAGSVAELADQATALVDGGVRRALVKGGHLGDVDSELSVDVLAGPEGTHLLEAPRVHTRNTHGTGCTLSSAVAVLRTRRPTWLEAVRDAKRWLTEALEQSGRLRWGHGAGPAHHFHRMW
jgi:hydroxymethylpyrimidine/phosphomethylpyrimidine kinase